MKQPNFAQIGGFLYFGSHFEFIMAAIADRNGHNMVQHVLLPVNIHFHCEGLKKFKMSAVAMVTKV
jgi:hypothetical protein